VDKTIGALRGVLGFLSRIRVAKQPDLRDLLDGYGLAQYCSFVLEVRRAMHCGLSRGARATGG
jgi:hypothetical protein